jgi:Protein of unknown function (DUF1631)
MAGIKSWQTLGGDDEMNQSPHDARAPPLATAPVALSSRTDLPPRVMHLLQGTLAICADTMQRALAAALDDFEVQLFQRAEQLRGGEPQHRCFDSLREIKRGRADVAPRFMIALEGSLANIGRDYPAETGAAAQPRQAAPAPSLKDLSLVQTRELEEALALQEFSARAEIRQAPALYMLGHRFGVLVASPIIDAEHLPIGPARFAAAMRHGCARLDIVVEHRVMLYHAFDHVITKVLDDLYAETNHYLIEHGILRHLQVLVVPRPKDGSADKHAAAPSSNKGAESTPSGYDSSNRTTADAHDTEAFVTMREMLNRRQSGGAGMAGANFVPSNDDVQSVLGALQTRPIAPMIQDGKLAQRSVPLLKQELLANLRQLAPQGQSPHLSEEDSDTIDLVGMLFDHLSKNSRPYGSTQSLMTKLQVPLVRVALSDKSFFTRRTHPARQLLNAIAETGDHWLDDRDGPTDRGLMEKMQLIVDRVLQDFDGNVALIEDMLREMSRHMQTLARKAEVTERRHVDAARGREKLGLARDLAREAIATRIARAKPSLLVRTLLEQAWTDVLALTLLRQGEKSEAYANRLAVADKLLASSDNTKASVALRDEIKTALDQVGYHRDDVQTIVQRFFESEPARGDDPSSSTEIAIKLKKKAHLGDDAAAASVPKRDRAHQEFPPGSAEARMLERLRALPFGTWFELSIDQKGERVRRKLAWYSTVTGHCLFVNRQGVRTDEKTLQQLAIDLVHGQAIIIEAEQESMVDRAWKAVMTSLRQLVNRDPTGKPA